MVIIINISIIITIIIKWNIIFILFISNIGVNVLTLFMSTI